MNHELLTYYLLPITYYLLPITHAINLLTIFRHPDGSEFPNAWL